MSGLTGVPRAVELPFGEKEVDAMIALAKLSPFPSSPPIHPDKPWSLGIEHEYLANLVHSFRSTWSWSTLETKLSLSDNFVVDIKDGDDPLTVHFVHRKSSRKDAIPLLLLHGWPGSFYDFHKVLDPLVSPPKPEQPAFHVVVPSLPGYFMSTLPRREGWTIEDTARIFNTLMTKVLGYKSYAGQGGDWGGYILRIIGSVYSESAPVLHFNFFRCPVVSKDDSSLSKAERNLLARRSDFGATGRGYIELQSTKPLTVGYAVGSSPVALLSYIGEKHYVWSDPRIVDPLDTLNTVALYYLSGCFATSVLIYNQAGHMRNEMASDPTKWRVKSKIGYSAFPYEIAGAPRADIAAVGPVVYYKEHAQGGHFPALDVPEEFVEDLREYFGQHWQRE